MAGRTSYYGGIVLDGLVFHIDAAKQESYAKRGIRYMQNGNTNMFVDFADTSKSPSTQNVTGTIINGTTFSNFAPYHLSEYYTQYWHNPVTTAWKDSAGIGTFYGNLEFDGVNDYVSFGSTPEMDGINDITVSAWFYVNKFKSGAVPGGGTTSIIASRYNGVNGWALAYNNQGVVYFDGRESGAEYLSVTASITINSSNSGLTANGGWYNAVGTKSGNVWKIYVAEPNRYLKYSLVSQDATIYTYPYQQSLLGTRTMGVGTTTFTTNNLYLGCVFDTPTRYHMDGRLMSLSVYNRALSLAEINQNYDSFSKRFIRSMINRGLNKKNVLITYYALDGEISMASDTISAREAELGRLVTILTYANLPTDLSSYSHIWDIDYTTNQLPLVSAKYTTYLQGGGAIFILGEHAGFVQRNNTLANFITSVGGGSITFDTNFPMIWTYCQMDNQFLLENSNSSVMFDATGRFSSIGNGTYITTTTDVIINGIYTYPIGTGGNAVVWKTGSLTNAPKGAIVSVLDVNIWEPSYSAAPNYGTDFIKNVSLILDRY